MISTRSLLLALLAVISAGMACAVEIQGHRGVRGYLPENTLPAFRRALEIGMDMLKLDTVITRDGTVVVSHDACLNPALTRETLIKS